MSVGREYLRSVVEAISVFEDAVKERESKFFGSNVSLQQDVDRARQKVLDAVVEIVTRERMAREGK